MTARYEEKAPTRAELDAGAGLLLLEFGSNACGICQAAQPRIAEALRGHDELPHLKIQDGRGRLPGRSFGVTLWPTLILLRDGKEVARVVRPATVQAITAMLAAHIP